MPKKYTVLIDSNELILGLKGSKPSSKALIDDLDKLNELCDFRINETIFQEITRNLPLDAKEKFTKLLNVVIIINEAYATNKGLIDKYKNLGLKKGDIPIAAYAELIQADFLISENRHFLKELKTKKFKILDAEQFFKEMVKQ